MLNILCDTQVNNILEITDLEMRRRERERNEIK